MNITPTKHAHIIFEFLSGKVDATIIGLRPKYTPNHIATLISSDITKNVSKYGVLGAIEYLEDGLEFIIIHKRLVE